MCNPGLATIRPDPHPAAFARPTQPSLRRLRKLACVRPPSPSGEGLHRCALGFRPAQMLVEARHDLDEVTRAITVIELMAQDFIPCISARPGRAGQAEDVGCPGNTGSRARL